MSSTSLMTFFMSLLYSSRSTITSLILLLYSSIRGIISVSKISNVSFSFDVGWEAMMCLPFFDKLEPFVTVVKCNGHPGKASSSFYHCCSATTFSQPL